jgi:YfiH family protein
MKTSVPSNSNLDRRGARPELGVAQEPAPTTVTMPIENSIYRIAALDSYPELLHGISTRLSPGGEDWNLSARRGTPQHPPSWDRALANRETLARRLGIRLDRMVGCQQVHGSEVAIVGPKDAGRGMHPDVPSIQGADAMVTDTPGLYLMALSADCPPVFFYDPVRRVIGLAHSGWKGTVARIVANAVEAMVDNFGSDPSDIVAAIGPGIGPCCYAVGPNVIEAVESAFPGAWNPIEPLLQARDGQVYFNLWEAIRRALLDAGLRSHNITVERVCTADNLDVFYSHRAEAGQCGLFGAVLGLQIETAK